MVLVWRDVAGQSRFRHDQTGDQDLGRSLSKSGAGSEDRRGSGQYVSPWMMTISSSLSSRVMLHFPCSPSVRPCGPAQADPKTAPPTARAQVDTHRARRMSPSRDNACTLATRTPPNPAAARATTHPLPSPTGPPQPEDPLHFLRRSPHYALQLCHVSSDDTRGHARERHRPLLRPKTPLHSRHLLQPSLIELHSHCVLSCLVLSLPFTGARYNGARPGTKPRRIRVQYCTSAQASGTL